MAPLLTPPPTALLTGQSDAHVAEIPGEKIRVHREVLGPLASLQDAARKAGFELLVVSGFRDYATQLRIWNEKATGKRPLLDDAARPLDVASLSPEAIVFAILRWSALPGASRHHWGTDIDVVDKRAMPEGYRVQLVPEEVEGAGLFAPFHDWLDGELERHGFFRPYREDRGGVSPERWHLSYRPLAEIYYDALTLERFTSVIQTSTMELKDTALRNAKTLFERFVRNISP